MLDITTLDRENQGADPDALVRLVDGSYANRSLLYAHLAARASLEQITRFLQWDAAQPAFSVYLRGWLDAVPGYLRGPLAAHVDEEEREGHSRLFEELLANLIESCPGGGETNEGRLAELNYTFSPACVREQDHAFFAGSFLATEIMSAKRCGQILAGLARLGFASDGRPHGGAPARERTYLEIHAFGDAEHARQVLRDFVAPVLAREPSRRASLFHGVEDRLRRSASYLRWYERERLH